MAQISRTTAGSHRIAILSPKAEDDLSDIHDRTAEQWGDEQAKAYSDFLLDAALKLADAPTSAPLVPNFGRVRVYVAKWKNARQGHRIFYLETAQGIEVVRVLHTAMNWQDHLKR